MSSSSAASTCAGRVAHHFANREPSDYEEFLDRVGMEDPEAIGDLNAQGTGFYFHFHDGSVLEVPAKSGPMRVVTDQGPPPPPSGLSPSGLARIRDGVQWARRSGGRPSRGR